MKPLEAAKRKTALNGRREARWIALWGGGAMLFAVVGLASVFLSSGTPVPGDRFAGRTLPPTGDVGTTASIPANRIEVYPSSGGVEGEQARRQLKAEMETLRREVAELRRAMAMLHDQRAAERRARIEGGDETAADQGPEFSRDVDAAVDALAGPPKPVETLPAPQARTPASGNPEATAPPPVRAASGDQRLIEEALPDALRSPVRIVAMPGTGEPARVASIPKAAAAPEPASQTAPLLSVTGAAGQIAADSTDRIERTDFAIDLGTHASDKAALDAWAELLKTQQHLPASLTTRVVEETDGRVRLFAGPYPNAADAAAACVYLGSGAITCKPSVFPRAVAAQR